MPLQTANKKDTISYRKTRGRTTNVRVLGAQPASPATSDFTVTAQITGGTLADAEYFYQVTVVVDGVESGASVSKSDTISGGAGSGSVDIDASTLLTNYPTATSWKVYGRLNGTEELLATITAPTSTYTDDGTGTPSGQPPTPDGSTRFRDNFEAAVKTDIPKATNLTDVEVYHHRYSGS